MCKGNRPTKQDKKNKTEKENIERLKHRLRKVKGGFSNAQTKKARDIAKAETPAKPKHTQRTLQEGQVDKVATMKKSKETAYIICNVKTFKKKDSPRVRWRVHLAGR